MRNRPSLSEALGVSRRRRTKLHAPNQKTNYSIPEDTQCKGPEWTRPTRGERAEDSFQADWLCVLIILLVNRFTGFSIRPFRLEILSEVFQHAVVSEGPPCVSEILACMAQEVAGESPDWDTAAH